MTWVLVGIIAVLVPSFVTLAFLSRKDNRETLAARDRIEKLDEERDNLERDLDTETANHAATKELLAKERDLRAVAESQRNQAWKESREETVRVIESSGIADAVLLGNRILSLPLPGSRLSETGDSALEKP